MGFRFRRSLRIAPGVRVNLSRSGPSLSLGTRGMTVNVGQRGTRMTVGLPGSGISYSTSLSKQAARKHAGHLDQPVPLGRPAYPEPSRQPGSTGLRLKACAAIAALAAIVLWLATSGRPATPEAVGTPMPEAGAREVSTPQGSATSLIPAEPGTVLVLLTENVREAPSRQSRIVGTVNRSERYWVFGRSGGWVRVGKEAPIGWVRASGLGN